MPEPTFTDPRCKPRPVVMPPGGRTFDSSTAPRFTLHHRLRTRFALTGATDFTKPGALCDYRVGVDAIHMAHDQGPQWLWNKGIRWLSFQAQNDVAVYDYDFSPYTAVGISCGVWGVTYNAANFFRDGRALGAQAVKLGAKHVMVDVEFAAVGGVNLQPIFDGLRAGGWAGPVSLTTLGAPDNPEVNDYAIEVFRFIDSGGSVLPQAYWNAHGYPTVSGYHPERCIYYWHTRKGVPLNRINLTVEFRREGTLLSGAQWNDALQVAGVRGAASIFLSYDDPEGDDYDGLAPTFKTLSSPEVKQQMLALAKAMETEWARQGMSQTNINSTRIRGARAVLESKDTVWKNALTRFKSMFGITP